jgi:hypothetical protein
MCEDTSEAGSLFIEAGSNRSSPTMVIEHSQVFNKQFKSSRSKSGSRRRYTKHDTIWTKVNCLDDMITPRGHVKLLLKDSLLNARRTKPYLGHTHWGDVQEFSFRFVPSSHIHTVYATNVSRQKKDIDGSEESKI